ncbi:hypothetical protein [Streptomyces sp. NPDC001978]|uniref:hypothetical protein n=1 Tax=Streptomyces sp. NPDC001978 TaxID=3364627 RepID=UPI0036803822
MTGQPHDPMRRWLTRLSLAAGIAFTATSEFQLARALGAHPVIAVMLPVAIDAYVVAALRWFRAFDITLSLALMGAAQVAAHLLDARVMVVNIPMVVVVSLLVPVALWRTHALARSEHGTVTGGPAEYTAPTAPVEVERVPESYPALPEADEKTSPPEYTKPVLAAETPRVRVSAPVPDDDDALVERVRADFDGRIPSYRELKDTYSIGQPRAKRIRAVLEGNRS